MDSYIERLELPDGQWADLLTRLPYDRALIVRKAVAVDQGNEAVFLDSLMRAFLVSAHVKDTLTGEFVDADATTIGVADMDVVDEIVVKAAALYRAWSSSRTPKAKAATGRASAAKRQSAATR